MRLLRQRIEDAESRVCKLLDLRRRAVSRIARDELELRLLLAVAGWERLNAQASAEAELVGPETARKPGKPER